jgi:hypothetical protein
MLEASGIYADSFTAVLTRLTKATRLKKRKAREPFKQKKKNTMATRENYYYQHVYDAYGHTIQGFAGVPQWRENEIKAGKTRFRVDADQGPCEDCKAILRGSRNRQKDFIRESGFVR